MNNANWSHDLDAGGWGNNELQYYQPDNVSLEGGFLTIEAHEEQVGGASYTSSRLISEGK
ncbi:MAG: hypothetical protein H8E21_15165 [Gammaproteobacteria bacterium]|nr:hypothetical protein [Gammaproteobacteria bacterium]